VQVTTCNIATVDKTGDVSTPEEKYITEPEQKCITYQRELGPVRGCARETVWEVNWERSVIRGGVEQTKESDVEAWH